MDAEGGGSRRNVRVVALALAGVVLLAGLGWAAARQIRSPAQIAADTAPPRASLISVPVERRALATEVIVRGTVRFGAPQKVVLPKSALKPGSDVVSRAAWRGARLGEGDIAMEVSGRPVFVLQGATPMHRDLGPGTEGADVGQLEEALARAGLSPGAVDGRYDGATAAAVAAYYRRASQEPFAVTDAQAEKLRTAETVVATARDHLLQMRLALRTARRGVTPAEVNQARLDAVAVDEAIPALRVTLATAREKAAAAAEAATSAEQQRAEAEATGGRDIAVADADVVTKTAAVATAVDAEAEAQRQLTDAPPEATAAERAALSATLRQATEAIGVARADLVAAESAVGAAHPARGRAIAQAEADRRRALRERRLAGEEAREARASLAVAGRKRGLARARIRILRDPPGTAVERDIVAAARADLARTRADLAQLAVRAGVQVPADEIIFFGSLPLRVDAVRARRGASASRDVMTVTNSRLAVDASVSPADAKLIRPGLRAVIEEQDLRVSIGGRVIRVAGQAAAGATGATGTPAGRHRVEIAPRSAPRTLVGASVKVSIAVRSTKGRVLAVPVAALSVAADGRSRVQVDDGRGRTRFVTVLPGLAAQGFVAVRGGDRRLRAGDQVVVGGR